MSKKGGAAAASAVASIVKLVVPAGKASAQPPVGPALGAKGVKAMDFAKEFNARTAHLEPGLPTPAIVTIQPDRTFSFDIRTPPTSLLLKRAAGITTGSGKAGSEVSGTLTMKHIYEIAKIKIQDVPGVEEEQMCKVIAGSARSMGLRIVQ
ncbi:mitochondrial 54S ribosomal protein YmL19 [Thecaphora frezii]